MADVSPTKWHLAHTSWFFETFILGPHAPEYVSPNPRYAFLFNSYYVQAGERHCRAKRGLVTRPTVREVFEYRAHVNEAMRELMHPHCRRSGASRARADRARAAPRAAASGAARHGHQARLLDEPAAPVVSRARRRADRARPRELAWRSFAGGVHRIGHEGRVSRSTTSRRRTANFSRTSSSPRGSSRTASISSSSNDGGYKRSELWLSPGLAMVQDGGWEAPVLLGARGRRLDGVHAFRHAPGRASTSRCVT